MREHSCKDIEYLGVRKDTLGEDKHFYRIGEHEVPHDCIEELEMEEVEE